MFPTFEKVRWLLQLSVLHWLQITFAFAPYGRPLTKASVCDRHVFDGEQLLITWVIVIPCDL